MFDDLRINITDILSNQFFFDLFFSDQEIARLWLSAEESDAAILRPVLYRGECFEEVAEAMRASKTKLSLTEREKLVDYAKRLDGIKPSFVKMQRPYRKEYTGLWLTKMRSGPERTVSPKHP